MGVGIRGYIWLRVYVCIGYRTIASACLFTNWQMCAGLRYLAGLGPTIIPHQMEIPMSKKTTTLSAERIFEISR